MRQTAFPVCFILFSGGLIAWLEDFISMVSLLSISELVCSDMPWVYICTALH